MGMCRGRVERLLGGFGTARKLQHGVKTQLLTVPVPPAVLTLMTRVELHLGTVGKGELDLNHRIGAARSAKKARR